ASSSPARTTEPSAFRREESRAAKPPRGALLFARLARIVAGAFGLVAGRDRDLLGFALLARDHGDVDFLLALAVDHDRGSGGQLRAEHEVGEGILDVPLDRAAQRPGAHRRVVALLD